MNKNQSFELIKFYLLLIEGSGIAAIWANPQGTHPTPRLLPQPTIPIPTRREAYDGYPPIIPPPSLPTHLSRAPLAPSPIPPPLPNHHDHPSSDHVFQTFLLPSHNQRIHGRCMYRACTKTSVRPPATELQAGVYIHGAAPGFHAAPFAAPATHDCQWPSAQCAHQTPPQRPHSLPA